MKTLSEESIEGMGKLENYDQEIKDSRNPALLLDAIELVLNVENQYLALRQNKTSRCCSISVGSRLHSSSSSLHSTPRLHSVGHCRSGTVR